MLSGTRVLVIESEVIIQFDIVQILEAAGAIQVVALRDPAAAKAIARDWPAFDLAVVEAGLREEEIVGLLQGLREAGVPTLVTSADPEAETRFARAGATYLGKPFGEQELLAACNSALLTTTHG